MSLPNPCWFLALVAPVLGMAEVSKDPPGRIAVYLGVEQQASAQSLDQMKREVETLLSPAGIRVDWRFIEQGRNAEVDHSHLYVLRMRGNCTTERIHLLFSELGPYGDVIALGSASTVDHQIQPFGRLECDPLRRSLAASLRGESPNKRDAVFGKVLGRVMAHELFHMMTGQTKHSDHGLFQSSQKVRDLATRSFSFTPAEQRALRVAVQ
ncbi:MAG: hypothetical protein HY820_32980 [Acidobacteria bacterium]|nr:hypothetical protein [Acidobacteriota bacterium]